MKKTVVLIFVFLLMNLALFSKGITYDDAWSEAGFNLNRVSDSGVEITFSIEEFNLQDVRINGEDMQNIILPNIFLPNDEGMPNLPGSGRYIAIPQGAKAELHVIDYRIERYLDIDIAPAPRIPLDTDTGPLEYKKNMEIYNRDENYPENFIKLSDPSKLRGVDVVMLGITPFQYNPVTKELIVYCDIKLEIDFVGGNGHFGEDKLRNRWWDRHFLWI